MMGCGIVELVSPIYFLWMVEFINAFLLYVLDEPADERLATAQYARISTCIFTLAGEV